MAVKASQIITLLKVLDISSVTLYFKTVNAGSSAPAKPTTATPSGWSTSEPALDISKDLYATLKTTYSDSSFSYSDPQKHSSYEAAKTAYNNATNALSTATAADNKIDNLQIGGRNLILNSNVEHYTSYNGADANGDGKGYILFTFSRDYLEPGFNYTFSLDVKSATNDMFYAALANNGTSKVFFGKKISTNNDYTRLTFTVNNFSRTDCNKILVSNRNGWNQNVNNTGNVYYKNAKLEKGNRATDWTPAPEDTEAQFTSMTTYVNGIRDNLQGQIDGAIQFWNGPNIPTLNNYPASDWTTEALKTAHQADIYTVIQDVSGELKQGKGYRFDKVSNVWTWVEITDNELSAVQALASSKATVFVAQPTTAQAYNIGDLWLKDNKLYKCITAKAGGTAFSLSHWALATDYTNDDLAQQALARATVIDSEEPSNHNTLWLDTNTGTLKQWVPDGEGSSTGDWEVINDFSELAEEFSEDIEALKSLTTTINTNLNAYYQSIDSTVTAKVNQTASTWGVTFDNYKAITEGYKDQMNTYIQNTQKWINFVDGTIFLGESDSDFTLEIHNNKIEICYKGIPISRWNTELFFSKEILTKKLVLRDASWGQNGFGFVANSNGSLSFRKLPLTANEIANTDA